MLVQENQLNWEISSAGTNGLHNGEAPHEYSQKVCAQHGIDISDQVSAWITLSEAKAATVLYALATDVVRDLKRMLPADQHAKIKLLLDELYPGQNRSVKDPWYGDWPDYIDVYEEIEAACQQIIEKFKI